VLCPRSLEGGFSHVHPDRASTGSSERRAELSRPAAHIQNPIAGRDLRQQKAQPALEQRRLQRVRQALPQVLVVLPDRGTVTRQTVSPDIRRRPWLEFAHRTGVRHPDDP